MEPEVLSSVEERFPDTEEVSGSTPLAPTKRLRRQPVGLVFIQRGNHA